jgi:hypothetical protein
MVFLYESKGAGYPLAGCNRELYLFGLNDRKPRLSGRSVVTVPLAEMGRYRSLETA